MMFGGIDLGTTLTKSVLLESDRDGAETVRIRIEGVTPREPEAILALVQSILERDPGKNVIWAFSSFRRAAVLIDSEGKPQISWARDALALPKDLPSLAGQTAITDRMATAHRWRAGKRRGEIGFDTFESWLAQRLTGRRVISEATAWLTGLWDVSEGHWQAECLEYLGATEQELPTVLKSPGIEGCLALPVLGDHQGSALAACTHSRSLAFVEVGTALAIVIGEVSENRPLTSVPLLAPLTAEYQEFIDPYCSVRMMSGKAGTSLPPWCLKRLHGRTERADLRPTPINSPRAVCHLISDALAVSKAPRPQALFVSGGFADAHLCQHVADICQTHVVWQRSISPAIGATLFAAALAGAAIPKIHDPGELFAPRVSPAEVRDLEDAWAETLRRETS